MTEAEDGARSKAKREQILVGARQVFLRDGFAAASTDSLAREAGVSKRTLYAYYPGKEELFVDVLRSLALEQPETRMLDFLRSMAPRTSEELYKMLIGLAEKMMIVIMAPDYLAMMRVIIADSHRFPQLTEVVRTTIPEQAFKEIGDMLERARANGVALNGESDVMARMFLGPLFSFALLDGLLRPLSQPQPPDAQKLRQIVSLCMRAIAAEVPARKV